MAYQIFRYKLTNGEKKSVDVNLTSTEQSSTKEGENNEDDKQTSTD